MCRPLCIFGISLASPSLNHPGLKTKNSIFWFENFKLYETAFLNLKLFECCSVKILYCLQVGFAYEYQVKLKTRIKNHLNQSPVACSEILLNSINTIFLYIQQDAPSLHQAECVELVFSLSKLISKNCRGLIAFTLLLAFFALRSVRVNFFFYLEFLKF